MHIELTPKNLLILAIVALAAGYILFPAQFKSFLGAAFSQDLGQGEEGAGEGQGEEGAGEGQGQEIETPSGVTQIIAISSVNLKATFVDALNETTEQLNPTFYVWREGSTEPTAVSVSGGTATIALKPREKISYAAGKDGSYYWVKKDVQVGITDTPIEVKLYSIPGATGVSVKVFDTSYHDLSDGAYNLTLGAGQDADLQVMFDVVDEYTALFRPHICVAYNDSVVNKIKIAGLLEVDAPTRIISTLDQCFDAGLTYYTDSQPRQVFDSKVDIITGVNPNVNNSAISWYIIDKDIWYRDGKEYFVNPINNADMGSTTAWSTTTYFA